MPKCDFNNVALQLRHGSSPVNLLHIFRIPFPKNTSEWLLLTFECKLIVNNNTQKFLLQTGFSFNTIGINFKVFEVTVVEVFYLLTRKCHFSWLAFILSFSNHVNILSEHSSNRMHDLFLLMGFFMTIELFAMI